MYFVCITPKYVRSATPPDGKHCVMVYRNGCIDLAFDHSVCVWKMFQRLFSGKRQTTVEETKN